MEHTATIPQESPSTHVRRRQSFVTIHVTGFSPVIPFCRDVTGQRMKLGCIENLNHQDCVLFIDGTEMRYNLHKNERLLCILAEDDARRLTEAARDEEAEE